MRAVGGALAGGMLSACAARASRFATAGGVPRSLDADGFRAARRFAETRFGRIAYVEHGSGDAALFLHGLPLNGFQWRGAIERLSIDRRCIAPDFMGLGYTEVARGQDVGPDAQVEMLAAFLDTLSISNVDIVASDSGGQAAQLLVARHPGRVRTLLLTNCDTEIDSPPAVLLPAIELAREGRFADEVLAPRLADKEFARSEEGLGRFYSDVGHPTDEAIETYLRPLVSSPERKELLHEFILALAVNPLVGIEPALRRSDVPARIVWGAADTVFSAESPAYLDATFGNSRGVRRLEGRRLFWPEELPGVLAEEARRLWRTR